MQFLWFVLYMQMQVPIVFKELYYTRAAYKIVLSCLSQDENTV